MAQTFTNLLYHCIFSTRDRQPQIDEELRPQLFAYVGGIVRAMDGVALTINRVADHLHLLLSLPPTVAIAEAMRVVKANSSKWVHEQWPERASFAWQTGYGAFTVSQSQAGSVKQYIAEQEEHHKRMTFQEEFVAFLKRHGIAFDERYIWQ
jgi:REP element-mobilizing transposase RayT